MKQYRILIFLTATILNWTLSGCGSPTIENDGGLSIRAKMKGNPTDQAVIRHTSELLQNRLAQFCPGTPNVNYQSKSGTFEMTLPGAKDEEFYKLLITTIGVFKIMETYDNQDMFPYMEKVDQKLALIQESNSEADSTDPSHPLWQWFTPSWNEFQPMQGPILGYSKPEDTAKLNAMFRDQAVVRVLPPSVSLFWGHLVVDDLLPLLAVKRRSELIGNEAIASAQVTFGYEDRPEITLRFHPEYHEPWKRATRENIGKALAIIIDGEIYAFPHVAGEIEGGVSTISSDFTMAQAQLLAGVLNSGALQQPLKVIESKKIEGK